MNPYDLMWVPFAFVASIFPPVYKQSRLVTSGALLSSEWTGCWGSGMQRKEVPGEWLMLGEPSVWPAVGWWAESREARCSFGCPIFLMLEEVGQGSAGAGGSRAG